MALEGKYTNIRTCPHPLRLGWQAVRSHRTKDCSVETGLLGLPGGKLSSVMLTLGVAVVNL